MNAVESIVMIVLVCCIGIALVATHRIIKEKDEVARTFAQLAFAWLLPLIGPLMVLHVLRKDLERGSGEYASEEPPLRDGGHVNQRDASID
jgi:hypothetical protein